MRKNKAAASLTGLCLQPEGVYVAGAARAPGGRPRVTAWGFHPWGEGGGHAKVLTRVAADYGLKRSRCTMLLDEADYQLLLTEAPEVPADELKAAVRWRVKDLIDFHINDATIDIFDLPGAVGGKGRSMYAVVARNEAIKRRVDLIEAAGMNLDIIDIPEMAQRNLAALLPEDATGVVFLSFQAGGGLITVTKQGDIYLSRSLDVGLEEIQQGGDLPACFDRISLEIQRSLDYFDSHFRQAPIGQVVLAPLPTEAAGMVEHLNANLNVKARMMDLGEVLEFDVRLDPAIQARCLPALGAALRQETAVL